MSTIYLYQLLPVPGLVALPVAFLARGARPRAGHIWAWRGIYRQGAVLHETKKGGEKKGEKKKKGKSLHLFKLSLTLLPPNPAPSWPPEHHKQLLQLLNLQLLSSPLFRTCLPSASLPPVHTATRSWPLFLGTDLCARNTS